MCNKCERINHRRAKGLGVSGSDVETSRSETGFHVHVLFALRVVDVSRKHATRDYGLDARPRGPTKGVSERNFRQSNSKSNVSRATDVWNIFNRRYSEVTVVLVFTRNVFPRRTNRDRVNMFRSKRSREFRFRATCSTLDEFLPVTIFNPFFESFFSADGCVHWIVRILK